MEILCKKSSDKNPGIRKKMWKMFSTKVSEGFEKAYRQFSHIILVYEQFNFLQI